MQWRDLAPGRDFALAHSNLSLKDRVPEVERIPSEFIEPLARIRTDLDQFSFVERESLRYHGYTLIDAQLDKYCLRMADTYPIRADDRPPLHRPPLFRAMAEVDADGETPIHQKRRPITDELAIGSQSLFLLRTIKK